MMREDMPLGFPFPGECARCGAQPGERCNDWNAPRRQGKTKGQRTQSFYCIITCHGRCNVYWYRERVWIAPVGSDVYDNLSLTLAETAMRFKSFWEYAPTRLHPYTYVAWYRGRYMKYNYMSWFGLPSSPFPTDKQVFYSDIETRQLWIADAGESQTEMNLIGSKT